MKTAMKNTARYRRARSAARPRCQRFTFKAVRDTEGEILYYLILPYLKLSGDVEAFYRENYHLTLKTSGEIGICTTCTSEDPADECRWTLIGDMGHCTVQNGDSYEQRLSLDIANNRVSCGWRYDTDVWQIMPICLNVIDECQLYTNTCGAACATMIMNYLGNYPSIMSEETFWVLLGDGQSTMINDLRDTVNENLNTTYNGAWYSWTDQLVLENVDKSVQSKYPVIMSIRVRSFEKEIFGYTSPENSGHFVVIKGLFYDVSSNEYQAVVSDPHYKFSTNPNRVNDVNRKGGRDLVVSWDVLCANYQAWQGALMYHS